MGALWQRALRRYFKRRLGALGTNSQLSPRGDYLHPQGIEVGDDVYIGPHAMISAVQGIRIGDGVVIGPRLVVMAGDHQFRTVGRTIRDAEPGLDAPVVIERDVWIGARVTILKGVTIGEGAILGAGSVVTRDMEPYSIAAGNPARRIGTRFSSRDDLARHLDLVGSSYAITDLEHLYG